MLKESEKPGRIESQFRHELGKINPYLCLIDSAGGLLVEKTEKSLDKNKYLKSVAGKYGHYGFP